MRDRYALHFENYTSLLLSIEMKLFTEAIVLYIDLKWVWKLSFNFFKLLFNKKMMTDFLALVEIYEM